MLKNKKPFNLIFSKKNLVHKKEKNLFIGRWINQPNLKKIKIKNNEYYDHQWLNRKKQTKDFEEVKKIYFYVLKNLVSNLNRYHKKNYNIRQWELILFFFLYHYIPVVYDRWNIIKNIKRRYKLNPVNLFNYVDNNFLCKDSIDVLDLIFSDSWNDWIISEIIKAQKLKYFVTRKKKIEKIFTKKFKSPKKRNLLRFKNNNKFFLTNLELPRIQKLKLNLKLNQIKFFYDSPNLDNINIKNRKKRIFKNINTKNQFLNFMCKNIYQVLPTNFIENFYEIEKYIKTLNWPKNPSLIMTSYSHYTDEAFKIYTANKIVNGAKFLILQHGHQGHHNYCGTFYEKRVCDKYITWGNNSKDNKTIPLFITTNMGKKIIKTKPRGILLKLTEFPLTPWKSNHAPREIESVNFYKKNLLNFLLNVDKKTQNTITIKSYDFNNLNYVTKAIKSNIKNIKIKKFKKLKGRGFEEVRNKKLIIETFNSTGFLELLSLNSPVILITTKKLFNIKKEYEIYYKKLIDHKIIFFDPFEAADHVSSNLFDIEKWWFEKKRQKAIQFFCKNMCKYENCNINKLAEILKNLSK